MTQARRNLVLISYIAVATVVAFVLKPIPQIQSYHDFADDRTIWGIANFFDVGSNAAFLIPGLAGLALCLARPREGARWAWTTVFLGVCAVVVGSSYYHLAPSDARLFWDRLPMTVGFTALFVAMVDENVAPGRGNVLLAPAVAVGFLSLLYWVWADDLRPYFWVQAVSLGTVVAIAAIFPDGRGQRRYLIAAALAYGAAIICEHLDKPIFGVLGGTLSGHTIKHLLAALALYQLFRMLRDRAAVSR